MSLPTAQTEVRPGAPDMRARPAVAVSGAYKVFGKRPKEAVAKLRAGASRDDVKALGTAAVIDASFEVRQGEILSLIHI